MTSTAQQFPRVASRYESPASMLQTGKTEMAVEGNWNFLAHHSALGDKRTPL